MNNIKKMIKNKKGLVIGICCAVVVLIVGIGFAISFSNKEDKKQITLNEQMNLLSISWYEKNYYPSVIERDDLGETFLAKYKDIGLKVDLENLYRTELDDSEESNAIKTRFEEKKCDIKNSRAIIYPQEPYGEKDYKIDIELNCEIN